MSVNQVGSELLKLILMGKNNQEIVIKRLDNIYRDYGAINIAKWRNMTNKKNSFLHELVEKEMIDVIRHIIVEHHFDINVRRDTDGITPFQLASENQNTDIRDVLKELGADTIETVDVSKWSPDDDKEKSMNIVWMDLEMTEFQNPEILECAIIITDKDLKPLEKKNWVIHFEQDALDKLAEWHQKTFADIDKGGNGLFSDILKSKLTKEEVENDLLNLISRHCPKGRCPLAGSSIHTDKDVLKQCMPKVNDYLDYHIIDVSSFGAIMRRWAPDMQFEIKSRLERKRGQNSVSHRAMDDIIYSINFMKEFRQIFPRLREQVSHIHVPSNHHHHRAVSNHNNHEASNQHVRRSSSNPQSKGNDNLPKISSAVDSMDLYTDERRLIERIRLEEKVDVKTLKLKEKWQNVYDENPHLREVFLNRQFIQIYDKDFTKENRILITPIQSENNNGNFNPKKISTTEHWGQRKLLLTEIEFLTNYGSDNKYLVVYVGVAPGIHINFLSSLFPNLEFVIIDDKPLNIQQLNRIQIRSEKFTKDLAKRYGDSKDKILFICNVRTYRAQADGQNDETEDMRNQLDWYNAMKPNASLLNFRLSRETIKTQYLKGYQIIEPWASKRAVECRLIVKKDAKMVEYNYQDFEEDCRRFHNVTRVMYYKHNMDDVENEGLDHCYDCRAEIFILQEYLTKVQKLKLDNKLKTSIADMSCEISKQINDKTRPKFINIQRTLNVIPKKISTAKF